MGGGGEIVIYDRNQRRHDTRCDGDTPIIRTEIRGLVLAREMQVKGGDHIWVVRDYQPSPIQEIFYTFAAFLG